MTQRIRPPLFSLLAEYLIEHRERVTAAWMHALREHPGIGSADGLPQQELQDHLPNLIDDLAARLRARDETEEPDIKHDARMHGKHRWSQGFEIIEIFRELGLLRQVLLQELFFDLRVRMPGVSEEDARRAELVVHRFFDEMSGDSVAQYVEEQQRHQAMTAEVLAAQNQLLEEVNDSRLGLLRAIAHELRNSLNAQSIAMALIEQGEKAAIRRSDVLEMGRRNLTEMAGLIDQLLDYSVLVSGQGKVRPEKIVVADLVQELETTWRSGAENGGLSLHVVRDGGLTEIVSDRARIKQIAGNLISNAVKYQRKDGDRTIELRVKALGTDHWALEVEDTGTGIAPEDVPKLFREFSRVTKDGSIPGTGLGLAITKRLTELLGGSVSVRSQWGVGSAFTVTLPIRIGGDGLGS